MDKKSKTKPISVYNLMFLMLFQSVSGIFGGGSLIIDPSGGLLKMPISFLNGSPFPNFLIPGIILFLILGIFPFLLFLALIFRPEWKFPDILNIYKEVHWAWTFSLYVGIMLIIWIDFEIIFIREVSALQAIYSFVGVLIVIFALLPKVKAHFKK